jgi:hypothetical protein
MRGRPGSAGKNKDNHMKITLYAIALTAVLSTASFAADFTGKLVDASCNDQNNHAQTSTPSSSTATTSNPASPSATPGTPSTSASSSASSTAKSGAASCNATTATTAFAIEANGKTYKLDASGNTKAMEALKSRADRSADPTKAMSASYTAKVSGTESNGTIAVDSIQVQ